jgi:hypothetical protein
MNRPACLCAAFACSALLACSAAPRPAGRPAPVAGTFGRVEVRLADPSLAGLAGGDARRLAAIVRQSARDWLEQADRLAPPAPAPAPLALEITLESLRLRSAATTWLFAWAAAPDHLAARVRVLRAGTEVSAGAVRVESALAGFSWRDPAPRLERLARRLGRRVVSGL